jgi:hypothetical protein
LNRSLLGLASFAVTALAASPALAQSTRVTESNWRQADRAEHIKELPTSPQNFALELRFGPYYPDVDGDPALGGRTPFNDIFGDSKRFYIGVEFDWQALRIPYVGVIGPGIGWGYTSASAKAPLADGSGLSGEDTSLTVMPMHLSAVLRADEIMRRFDVPIVPYAKLGLGFATWSASNSNGPSHYPTDPMTSVLGRGTTWGVHFALGGMLCLNFFDERAAARLDESTGVNHAYVFGEWMNARLDGLGSRPQMHVGSSTWVLGLALDM